VKRLGVGACALLSVGFLVGTVSTAAAVTVTAPQTRFSSGVAAVPTPTPTPIPPDALVWGCCGVTTTASASPTTVQAGSASTIVTTAVTLASATTVLVDIEIYDPNGSFVFGGSYPTETFAAAETHQYVLTYAPAANAIGGSYVVRTGIFAPGWGNLLDWNSSAGSFAVTPGGTPTPAPSPFSPPRTTVPSGLSSIHVNGNRLVNATGTPVQFAGVNHSGSEFACIQGWGIFDGATDLASLGAIRSWGANAVRVPLNEDCWLAINGAPAQFSGALYQQAIADYVGRLGESGLYTVLELHWSAPGIGKATGQQPMPDLDHSVTFWAQVAATFKDNGTVIFDLHNEPFPDNQQDTSAAWTCWRDGGTCSGFTYKAAGMTTLLNTVRATGATNVIALSGVSYANALGSWLAYRPVDPLNNLVAAWHVYDFNACSTPGCFDRTVGPVAERVPVIALEFGSSACNSAWLGSAMSWFRAHQLGYFAWTWNTWGASCSSLSLITDYAGTPTVWGQIYKTELAAVATVAPTPAATLPPIASAVPVPTAPLPTAVQPVAPISQPASPVATVRPTQTLALPPAGTPAVVASQPPVVAAGSVGLPPVAAIPATRPAAVVTPANPEAVAAKIANGTSSIASPNQPTEGLGLVSSALGEMIGVLTRESPYAGSSLTQLVGPERATEIMRVLAAAGEGFRSRSAPENAALVLASLLALMASITGMRRLVRLLRRGLSLPRGTMAPVRLR
jgi:endoglucanase